MRRDVRGWTPRRWRALPPARGLSTWSMTPPGSAPVAPHWTEDVEIVP